MKILAINPGSTSTKIALFNNLEAIYSRTLRHDTGELVKFDTLVDQLDFRYDLIIDFLKDNDIDINSIDAFIGRGGLLKPLESGIYEVNDLMKYDLINSTYGTHASNLGALLAGKIADTVNKKAYIADPVVVDEMSSTAKFSGLNGITRKSIFHALNQKAVAKKYADKIGIPYESLNLIVAHLGGGISVGLHKHGRVTDVNNALDGDGPFSPQRTGGLPVGSVYELVYGGQYTLEQMRRLNYGFGGLMSYLNTSDAEKVSEMIIDGHPEAKRILKAMVYQIAKEIGALYAVTRNRLDAIIITGGLAYNQDILQPLLEYIDHLGEIVVYPGEDELEALAFNVVQLNEKIVQLKEYV